MHRKLSAALGSVILGVALGSAALASAAPALAASNTYTQSGASLRLAAPATLGKIATSLAGANGQVDVVVELTGAPLAIANGVDSKHLGGKLSHAQQMSFSRDIGTHQQALLQQIMALGGKEVARVRIAYNAVIVRVDATKLQSIARNTDVLAIRPLAQYKVALSTTVPYIGATALHAAGYDGKGIRVAMLDSGIDYTHRDLGGPGTVAAYKKATADPTSAPAGLFPTQKVIGGIDFVGDTWPNTPDISTDDNPIDLQGHGTHTADILAGRSNDGKHVGVAPGAQLYAVKVCSSVSTACNGAALLLGLDFALDPNGDGSMDDAVDIINMSLGVAYGQIQDDASFAAANAVKAGVVVVASAGNDGDKPYVTSSPASAPEVISVAETQVPTAEVVPLGITAPASIAGKYANTAAIDWAPVAAGASGQIVYVGRGCLTGTASGTPDPLLSDPAGKIALVDRGTCNISEKVHRLSAAGAHAILIGLVAPGDAISFSNGGECPATPDGTCKPSLVVTMDTANTLKNTLAAGTVVTGAINPADAIALVGSMASTSARGPDVTFNRIKPDIGAPGASVSAVSGSGDGEAAFGGTSGAAPMVAGAAALLLQAYPGRSPAEIKSLLMNTADTDILTNPALLPGQLAPITRIGGGEVRVDQAAASQTAAWDEERGTGSLSFGYQSVVAGDVECRPVRVKNYSRSPRLYRVKGDFRYADDAASRALSFILPPVISVGPRQSTVFPACVSINALRLPVWTLNGGAEGGNGALLQTVEYDGYLTISDSTDNIHLAWQVLPHRSAHVRAEHGQVGIPARKTAASVTLDNLSPALAGRVEIFALTGTSPRIPRSRLPGPGDDLAVVDLRAVGARLADTGDGTLGLQFAIATYGQRSTPAYPAGFEIDIDTNLDGKADWIAFTEELNGLTAFAGDGRTVVYLQQVGSTTATAYFFADADLDSGNMIMTVPLSALGISPDSKIRFSAFAYDNYFTGRVSDEIDNMVFTPGLPKFFGSGLPAAGIPARQSSVLTIQEVKGGDDASPSQSGILLLYRDAPTGEEAEAIQVSSQAGDPRQAGPGPEGRRGH